MRMKATTLHILTPLANQAPTDLIEEKLVVEGDLIADLREFPPSVHEIKAGLEDEEITSSILEPTDYWALARQWVIEFTEKTGLQDILSVEGYGFWLTLNGQKFVPAMSDIGNTFIHIDLIEGIKERFAVRAVNILGDHRATVHLAQQAFGESVQIQPSELSLERPRPPRKIGLILSRLILSIVYFLYALVRTPEICFFSTSNLLRLKGNNGHGELRDIYLGNIAKSLKSHGWRIIFVEKYGWNATREGLFARGFFFPNDLLFLLSLPAFHRRIKRSWIAKWYEIQPILTKHILYRGYNLAPLVFPIIIQAFSTQAPQVEVLVHLWKNILRIWHPSLLFINNSYGLSALPAIIAAKQLGIPTIEQQHGIINRDHIPYTAPRSIEANVKTPLCDTMTVWGIHTKQLLVDAGAYTPDQVVVCGFPHIDSMLKGLPPQEEILSTLNIPIDAPVVLYTSNMIAAGFLADILDSIQNLPPPLAIHWIIKLHPREKTRSMWETAIEKRSLETVQVVEGSVDFYALLAACDIHVSFTSTTLLEAAILGKINLGFEINYIRDPIGYADAHAYLPIEPHAIGPTARGILQNPYRREHILQKQQSFADDWCLHDGHAVDRIVAHIESIAPSQKEDL